MPIYPTINGSGGGGGSIGGSSGATDNAIIRADGTGGSTIQSSLATIDDSGNIISPTGIQVGNSASIGTSGGMNRTNDIATTITDFSAAPAWRHFANRLILNPNADTTATANAILNQISTDAANTHNFGTMVCGSFVAQHLGSGNVTTISGFGISSINGGSGTVTSQMGMNVNSYNSSTGTVTSNYGLRIVTGSFSASGTVTNNYGIHISSPYTTGTLTNHIGLSIENQSAGGSGFAIYAAGGKSYHNGNFGLGRDPGYQLDVQTEMRVITTSTIGPAIILENTGFAGAVWKIISAGSADVGGGGSFQISSYSDGTTPFVITSAGSGSNVVWIRNARFTQTIAASAVPSSGVLTLGDDGNIFSITGTSAIDGITTTRWNAGSIITLIFAAAATANHNSTVSAPAAPILLSGSANQTMTADSTLTLLYDGTNWQEIGRKIA